ncbi:NAD(P)H-dependent oxidoreductase [Listeria seeligeri]|uniref:NAD(P)H dehydrogenase n=2 Tax=Listeria seeligeri TaxID=1640 RepID=A0A7X0X061_LISSE|nr:NAD(P)H-dependent oxidoreductase [Listeria seeligeri]EFS00532.1 NADPH-q uinone reductase [Listeria seeligeri FSL N1-067]KKD45406.1 NAD(P)H dehydrogenase [Listeria seeligeri]MBC1485196.1 NAD(P)H-dependent oxidoreductase [Listeria seeligeri]MBC1576683.1 NAD(P)H-dependent oxidoreductase [Listeria seeligeri]MBC1580949.1 NAD(P)H-dependent oxidoreductase [Listeria seeligeri]
MQTTIITGHPYSKSFNHALVKQIQEKTKGEIINLIEDKFNPAMLSEDLAGFSKGLAHDPLVTKYQEILQNTDKLIFVIPIWWYDLPAIYKGFLDKVMLKDFAYTENKGRLVGKLTHIQEVIIITTSEAPKWYIQYFAGNPIKALKNRVFKDIGLKKVSWIHQGNIKTVSNEKRAAFVKKSIEVVS